MKHPENTEDRYSQLLNFIDEGYCVIDVIFDDAGKPVDWRYLETNQQFVKHGGLPDSAGQLVSVFYPDIEAFWFEFYGNVAVSGIPARMENEYKTLGKWFDIYAYKIGGNESRRVGVLFRDVTGRKQTETALRQNEQHFRSVLDNSIDIIYRINIQTGHFEYVSPSAEKITGYTPEQYMSFSSADALAVIHPDDLPVMRAAMARLRETRSEEAIYRQRIRSGEYRWISNHMSLIEDSVGQPLYSNGSIRDITDIRLAEEKLRESEERFRTVQDNSLDRFTILKPFYNNQGEIIDFTYVYQNAQVAKTSGRSPEEMTGHCMTEFFPTFTRTTFFAMYKKAAETGQPLEFEDEYNSDGVNDWFRATVTPVSDGIAVATQIITERKKTEEALKESERKALALVEELEKADKNKNQFISVLSHELRNPLAVIVASLSLLEVADRKEQIAKTKDIIKRQTGQLTKLVDDLLELTRINQNKIRLKKESFNLSEIVKNAALDHQPKYKAKGLLLRTDLPQGPVFLNADSVRIAQCIGNLLQNALKFTSKNGDVVLSLGKENDEAVISVRDNGMGISPDFLTHIFDPFTQADDSIDRLNNDGLGLGLSITKGIAELHGGTIAAFSDGAGKGSLFTIRLPLTDLTDDARNSETVGKANRNYKILLIDDNESLTDVLCSVFSITGHQAYAARNGTEGIKKAKKIRPDIIFCDIGLPGLSGYEVAKILKADEELKRTFLIALTGYTGIDEVERTKAAGFDRHLAKPVDMALLEKILAEI